MFAFVIAT